MSKTVTINCAPFLSLLALLFIGLKLTGHIDWSWFLVLSPLLIPMFLVAGVILVVGVCVLAAEIDRAAKRRRFIKQIKAKGGNRG